MTIEFIKRFDVDKIKKEILEKQKTILDRAMVEAATGIVQRTRQKQDAQGGTFKPLTPAYKKYKTKKGRLGVPDLTFSGRMLAAIASKIEQPSAAVLQGTIFFNSALEAAKAKGNMRLRNFFALSRDQINRILSLLRGF